MHTLFDAAAVLHWISLQGSIKYRFHLSVYVLELDAVREPSTGRDEQQDLAMCPKPEKKGLG